MWIAEAKRKYSIMEVVVELQRGQRLIEEPEREMLVWK